jgi:hypothetical protein
MTRNQLALFWGLAGIMCVAVGLAKHNWQFCLAGAVFCFTSVAFNANKTQ